ncbi:hypothetical protein G7Y89_g8250 [Cudoniella acicularis]|uniref:Uncharacterized protein n=1 Tax=Cudoniella acicularis TaxID=354080 RepID=A0A8H4W193_9HELO|nr:hypothetical protein G7Y89_g8250 [Cudoniella acicularis]
MSCDQEEVLVLEMDTRPQISRRGPLIAVLRTVQLTVGFAILFLTGYGASIFQGDFFHTFGTKPHHRVSVEIITLIFWLSSFSLLVWECTDGDATFAVLGDSGDPEFVTYVTASSIKSAIIGLKVATGLACVNWVAFAATFVIAGTCWFP